MLETLALLVVAAKDADPARHKLSVLWGRLRDVKL